MNLYFRLLKVLALGLLYRGRDGGEVITRLRVWPGDLDVNLHVNNGRYLTLLDLGRMDLLMKSGMAGLMMKRRIWGVAAAVGIRFKRPLRPFQVFRIRTRVACWDEKWMYIIQTFEREDTIWAEAMVKVIFRKQGRTVAPADIMTWLGRDPQSPRFPESIQSWIESQSRLGRELSISPPGNGD